MDLVPDWLWAGLKLVGAAAGGGLLTVFWADVQKRREVALSAASEFHRLYGEFFAIWKIWNFSASFPEAKQAGQRELFARAASAEAGIESLLVRIATTRRLTDSRIADLGRFRQGFQQLREVIRDGRPLPWKSSEHPEYLAFKELACSVSRETSGSLFSRRPSAARAQAALKAITSNRWESSWKQLSSDPVFKREKQLA